MNNARIPLQVWSLTLNEVLSKYGLTLVLYIHFQAGIIFQLDNCQ